MIKDKLAYHLGIWSLRRVFGECPKEDFDPECTGCQATKLIAIMQGLLKDSR